MSIHSPQASFTVSAFFMSEEAISTSIKACLNRGVPRDLIDVALSTNAARIFYKGMAGPLRDSWFSWTGRGALVGLLISSAITLITILLFGYQASNQLAIIQLLGPDIGVIVGALLGAIYGWLKPGDIKPMMKRVLTRDDAALLLIHLQPYEEANHLKEILYQYGGQDTVLEQDNASAVGAE